MSFAGAAEDPEAGYPVTVDDLLLKLRPKIRDCCSNRRPDVEGAPCPSYNW